MFAFSKNYSYNPLESWIIGVFYVVFQILRSKGHKNKNVYNEKSKMDKQKWLEWTEAFESKM